MKSMRKDIVWPAATCIAVALAITAAISLRGQHGDGKREELREALGQESASPYRWCDLGEALLEDGQKEKARYCFQLAEKLAPNVPPIWMRAAFFHFQMEETEAAIQCSARVLKMAPDYDQAIFNYYDRLAPSVEAVLPHLGDNRRAGQAYFRHLLGSEATGPAATAWEWLRKRRFADDGLAAEYVDLLLKQWMTGDAAQVWASCVGRRRGDCPGFQSSVQWRFQEPADRRSAGLEDYDGARRGDGEGSSGRQKRPVVTAYFVPGSGKPELTGTRPKRCARTGEYVFQAYARTRDLTTDEGIRFHIFNPESSARLDVYTEQLRGTNDWTRLETRCRVRAGTRLILV